MSEQNNQDDNGTGPATEQNPMVQRISLEVKRREPSLVSICSSKEKHTRFVFENRSKNLY